MNPLLPTDNHWLETNRENVARRLAWLKDKPEGLLCTRKGFQILLIHKIGTQIQLRFFSRGNSEIQSRLDLQDPFHLLATYSQAMILGLLWKSTPKRIHVVGLGGARLPLVLHHHFPKVGIDCTEIDPEVAVVAREYFGLEPDDRLRVFIEDGRNFLARRDPAQPYDLIFVDAFRGVGFGPWRLATLEFLDVCKGQLGDDGLLVTNILPGDPLIAQRIETIASAFDHAYVWKHDAATVVFAGNGPLVEKCDLVEAACALAGRHSFSFSIELLADHITPLPSAEKRSPSAQKPEMLADALSPLALPLETDVLNQIGRNDQCPCGSGKKFKKCHGSGVFAYGILSH
jgi:predicted O-methyltransferase YrrM